MARLSLLTATYNHSRYLENMVGAIVRQSRQPDEFHLLDDSSTDSTWPLLQTLASRHPSLLIHRNAANQGVTAAYESLFGKATGDYLCCPASDDLLLPGFIERGMALLEAHPEAGLCCGQAVWWNEETEEQYVGGLLMPREDAYLSPAECLALAKRGCLDLAGHTAFFRRDAFLALGGYREELRWYSDWIALYALAFRHGLCWVARPQAVMRTHAASYSAAGVRNDPDLQRRTLDALAEVLLSPAWNDVRPAFVSSGLLAHFGTPLLFRLLRHPRRWKLLGPRLVGYLGEPTMKRFKGGRRIIRALRAGTGHRTAPSALDLSAMRPRTQSS
jgi:glycosyltransferase involved in cell wall biosynthesis